MYATEIIFIENQATKGAGGVIYGSKNNHIALNKCDFKSNQAVFGGSINVFKGNLICNNCNSTNNTAISYDFHKGYGGFIYSDDDSNVTLKDCLSTNDSAICMFIIFTLISDGIMMLFVSIYSKWWGRIFNKLNVSK